MKPAYDPHHLPIESFARAGASLQGSVPLHSLQRLTELAQGDVGALSVTYAAQATLRIDAGGGEAVWLTVSAQAAVPLTCQRCLDPYATPVAFERDFRFVATEEQAEAEDESAQEDVLVLSRDFDLLALVEDELLLALPLVPMHPQCPKALKLQVADPDFEAATQPQAHPFAALAQLKNKT